MRYLIGAALVLAASSAFAQKQMIAKNGDDWVRLIDAPCPYASVIRFIPEQYRAEFRKADTRVGGQRYFACFVLRGPNVILQYEDGDQGILPAGQFAEEPGA